MKKTDVVVKEAPEPTNGEIVSLYTLDGEGKMKLIGKADEVQLKQIKKLIK